MRSLPPVGATPTQTEALAGGDATSAPNKGEAPDAIVAAIQQQAAALSYTLPDPVQMERERALANALAHAKAMQEKGADRDRALGYTPSALLGNTTASAGARAETPPDDAKFPAEVAVPTPALRLPSAQPRVDAAQLLTLDAQSHQLELRAALLDAYAKSALTSAHTSGLLDGSSAHAGPTSLVHGGGGGLALNALAAHMRRGAAGIVGADALPDNYALGLYARSGA